MSVFYSIFPNLEQLGPELLSSLKQTLQMVGVTSLYFLVAGMLLGTVLVVTRKGGILEQRQIYFLLDKGIDIIRSIPFLILMILVIPISRALVGTASGVTGSYVALIAGTTPFFARQIQSALSDTDSGVVEASQSMGFNPFEIIFHVYWRENISSMVRVTMITLINLVGLTAMAGAIGAGGLGDFAIRYGYQRGYTDMIWATVLLILAIVSLIQLIGNLIIRSTTH